MYKEAGYIQYYIWLGKPVGLTYKIGDVTQRKIRENPFIAGVNEPFISTAKRLTHPSYLSREQRQVSDAHAPMQTA